MKYFLDFDRTVFDTPAFKKAVARRPGECSRCSGNSRKPS